MVEHRTFNLRPSFCPVSPRAEKPYLVRVLPHRRAAACWLEHPDLFAYGNQMATGERRECARGSLLSRRGIRPVGMTEAVKHGCEAKRAARFRPPEGRNHDVPSERQLRPGCGSVTWSDHRKRLRPAGWPERAPERTAGGPRSLGRRSGDRRAADRALDDRRRTGRPVARQERQHDPGLRRRHRCVPRVHRKTRVLLPGRT